MNDLAIDEVKKLLLATDLKNYPQQLERLRSTGFTLKIVVSPTRLG